MTRQFSLLLLYSALNFEHTAVQLEQGCTADLSWAAHVAAVTADDKLWYLAQHDTCQCSVPMNAAQYCY